MSERAVGLLLGLSPLLPFLGALVIPSRPHRGGTAVLLVLGGSVAVFAGLAVYAVGHFAASAGAQWVGVSAVMVGAWALLLEGGWLMRHGGRLREDAQRREVAS